MRRNAADDIQKAVELLGLPSMVTKEEVKRRYRSLARRYHPDRPEGDARKMAQLAEAYGILMDYIENFRYSFDDAELARQFPDRGHTEKFSI
ncbi:J domain-containing protein [Nitratifractor sp.]